MTREEILNIKQVPIGDILAENGYSPVRDDGNIKFFELPLEGDDTTILRVNAEKNTWCINGHYGTSSDNIELVQILGLANGFLAACTWIRELSARTKTEEHYLTLEEIDNIVNNINISEIK